MVECYIHIKVKTGEGRIQRVLDILSSESAVVKRADVVEGPYDIIALVESKTRDEVSRHLVVDKLRGSPDVEDTLTMCVVPS